MRRPRQTLLNTDHLESGTIGAATATEDVYFARPEESTLRILIDNFMQQVPEPQKTAVEMCIMKRCTYKEAADWFTVHRGMTTDPKTVWRWAQQGVDIMGRMLAATPWAGVISPSIPEPDDE